MNFDTNVFGAPWFMQAAVPVPREQGDGHITGIGAQAIPTPAPGSGLSAPGVSVTAFW